MRNRELDPRRPTKQAIDEGIVMLQCDEAWADYRRERATQSAGGRRTGTCPTAHRRTRRLDGGRTRPPGQGRSPRGPDRFICSGKVGASKPKRQHSNQISVSCP